MDKDAERIFAQALGVARGLDHDAQNSGPAFGRRQCTILVMAFRPGDTEGLARSADNTGNIRRNLNPPDLAERVVGAGVIVESERAFVGDNS